MGSTNVFSGEPRAYFLGIFRAVRSHSPPSPSHTHASCGMGAVEAAGTVRRALRRSEPSGTGPWSEERALKRSGGACPFTVLLDLILFHPIPPGRTSKQGPSHVSLRKWLLARPPFTILPYSIGTSHHSDKQATQPHATCHPRAHPPGDPGPYLPEPGHVPYHTFITRTQTVEPTRVHHPECAFLHIQS